MGGTPPTKCRAPLGNLAQTSSRFIYPVSSKCQKHMSAAAVGQSPPAISIMGSSHRLYGCPGRLRGVHLKNGFQSNSLLDQRLSSTLAVFPANRHFLRRDCSIQLWYPQLRIMDSASSVVRFTYVTQSSVGSRKGNAKCQNK